MLRVLPLLGFSFGASATQEVTPVQKVIDLLTNLESQVQQEGKAEAGTYDTFACFCKDTTASKSTAITAGHDSIDQLAANIESDSASKAEKEADVQKRKKEQEALGIELDEATTRCMKEALEFEASIADLTKALGSLDKAISALNAAKPAFLQRDILREVSDSLGLAEVLGLAHNHAEMSLPVVQAFLQSKVDPDDPAYKFHSKEIISTLDTMKTDFTTKKTETESERDKAKVACDKLKQGLNTQMNENSEAMTQLKTDIGGLEAKIGGDRETLVTTEETLTDDQLYLKDLTQRCEVRARDWDQRSASRADELKALSEALVVLRDGSGDGKKSVQDLDAVNKRSFFLQLNKMQGTAAAVASGKPTNRKVLSFLQVRGSAQSTQKEDRALDFVRHEGIRLKSQMLASLSTQIASNPFGKVKQLIQQLIQRLLDEAAQEATKKGFCDTEVGKAKKDREYRQQDTVKLTAELSALEAKKDELTESIAELTKTLPELRKTLKDATESRASERKGNLDTIKLAKEGVGAVSEAITILKVYFKTAANAKVLLQASPVDEDTQGAGFEGAYRGKQDSARGIIGLLEVIKSDFDRTSRQTTTAEKEAQEEFVKFERTSKSDISAKETTLELNTQELEAITNNIAKKMDDLTTAQSLLDDALKVLENLKPMCIDTGMTYTERVQKREDEIAALKKAECILDPERADGECQ